ncbi:hypothetical protein [Metallosphaera hakonensis]|uniref:hypothetical protein n=1 Tax=Metallosphaera hakonensis TaxID=79601 RepID=UPI000ACEF676|nr:hypothetical protein [Metallosphaera hakonensis]
MLSSLLQGDSQVKYIVVDQEGKTHEAKTTEELDRIISDLKARNLKYEVKAEGVVNL